MIVNVNPERHLCEETQHVLKVTTSLTHDSTMWLNYFSLYLKPPKSPLKDSVILKSIYNRGYISLCNY